MKYVFVDLPMPFQLTTVDAFQRWIKLLALGKDTALALCVRMGMTAPMISSASVGYAVDSQ
ncbi:hypothetical protein AJ80_10105 [Polytolypa hystricis UAMH7299]|uniref:Uncharacterized protein n=1 Tax=Polytolypa hystricis (strain UAMH7299) TaxID=1447883 RepID=A0A2B7WE83_POLH7|nr:hypothetical protein AJ80_10105 [Polytolypa hystricis UAMH7299]